jgi:hypothetical protein
MPGLHTIKVHHHDLGNGQLRGQTVGQLRRAQRVDLPHYGDHASVRAVLGHLQIQDVGGEIAAHTPHDKLGDRETPRASSASSS